MMLTTTSKVNAVKKYAREKDYKNAAGIAEKINLPKVQSKHDLAAIADVYLKLGRYEDAKEVYTELYARHKSHKVVTGLIELCLKTKDPKQAEVYVREFRKMEPDNPERLIYRYRVDSMLGKSPEYLVRSLSKLKEEEYTDIWALELAKAYYKAGEILACSAECRSILQWFPASEVAPKAKVLLDACEDVTLLDAQKKAVTESISDTESEVEVFPAEEQKSVEQAVSKVVSGSELEPDADTKNAEEAAFEETLAGEIEYFVDLEQESLAEAVQELAGTEEAAGGVMPTVENEEFADADSDVLTDDMTEELAYELPKELQGKIDRVFFDDDDDNHEDDDDDDDDDNREDDDDEDDDDNHEDDDHKRYDYDDDDEFDEDEYVIRGYFTDEEIGLVPGESNAESEPDVETKDTFEYWESEPLEDEPEFVFDDEELATKEPSVFVDAILPEEDDAEEVSSDAWGKSLSMAFEAAYSEVKAVMPVHEDAGTHAEEAASDRIAWVEQVAEDAVPEIMDVSEQVAEDAVPEVEAVVEETEEASDDELAKIDMTEFVGEETEPEVVLPTFRGFEYEDRVHTEEDEHYRGSRFDMKSFKSRNETMNRVIYDDDDDDDDLVPKQIPDASKAKAYWQLIEEEEAEAPAETVAEETTETEAEDALEVTKVHGDLTEQALDAVLREDDKAIERALYNLLADEK